MCPWHFALPARLCAGSAASRKLSELGVRGVFASLFDQGGCSPKSDARTRTHSNSPAIAGRNTTDKNLRKLATASSSCGELRKRLSIAPAKLPQLGGFFIAAFELEYHALDVSVILVPPQEL
jgi:hypothetical protein